MSPTKRHAWIWETNTEDWGIGFHFSINVPWGLAAFSILFLIFRFGYTFDKHGEKKLRGEK